MVKWGIWKELLFPSRCVVCDEITEGLESRICEVCRDKITYIGSPCCMKCGKQLRREEKEYCGDCEEREHLFLQGSALYEYAGMSDSVYRFKYGGRMEYAQFYGRDLMEKKGDWLAAIRPDALIPVPIHASRMRKRGYNQAQLIARELSRLSGIPMNTTLIRRNKRTKPLKNLSFLQRQNNLKRAFKIWENDVKLNTIVIIDDIYTTGSTIDAMTAVLQEAGVKKVYCLVLAIGRGI